MGTIYTLDDLMSVVAIAKTRALHVHLDGARVANALVALDCSPADMTWRVGVDVLSLGATKNGALSAEAIVAFDDHAADELVYRTKRAGHVTSKMRFQSAQLIAYLTDGTWLRTAANSNARMADLAAGLTKLGVEFANRPDVNMLFAYVDDAAADQLEAAGLLFYRMGRNTIRLVTSWQTTAEDVAQTLAAFEAALT
jgi:threonine aldolase